MIESLSLWLSLHVFQSILDECEIVDDGSGMVERKPVIIVKLLSLTRSQNASIRLNAVWALMVSSAIGTFADSRHQMYVELLFFSLCVAPV